jgi:hypothetical protein
VFAQGSEARDGEVVKKVGGIWAERMDDDDDDDDAVRRDAYVTCDKSKRY